LQPRPLPDVERETRSGYLRPALKVHQPVSLRDLPVGEGLEGERWPLPVLERYHVVSGRAAHRDALVGDVWDLEEETPLLVLEGFGLLLEGLYASLELVRSGDEGLGLVALPRLHELPDLPGGRVQLRLRLLELGLGGAATLVHGEGLVHGRRVAGALVADGLADAVGVVSEELEIEHAGPLLQYRGKSKVAGLCPLAPRFTEASRRRATRAIGRAVPAGGPATPPGHAHGRTLTRWR